MTPKFGQWVTFNQKLYRASQHRPKENWPKHTSLWKVWAKLPIKGEGLFIGTRILYDGINEWENEVGYIFYPKSHFTAALVVPGPLRKPILVPMDAVEVIKPKTGFIVEERWADCGTDTVDRPLTPDEIDNKVNQWWDYITEYCTPCREKGPCMREGCDLWPYISIDGHPIRKVKP